MGTRRLASFRTRLLVWVLVPILIVQVAAMALELHELRERYQQALRVEAELVATLVGESMVQPLWDFDMTQVQGMAERLVGDGAIGHALVRDTDGLVLAEARGGDFRESARDIRFEHPLRYERGGVSEPLGQLVLTMPTTTVTETVTRAVFRKLALSAAILVLIGTALSVVLIRLSHPLVRITETIDRIGEGDLDVAIPDTWREDEIGQVARALEQLRRNEAEVAFLRSQNDERTRRERRRIRRALESTHDAIILADENGEIVYINPNASAYFPGAGIGAMLRFGPWIDGASAARVDAAVAGRTTCIVDAAGVLQTDGNPLNLLIRAGPIQNEDGSFLGTAVLATDHTERARQTERVRYLSEHDSLTGLANRRLLEGTLERWVEEEGGEAAVMLADLDNFKRINDTLGHPVGDALLRHVARLFERTIGQDGLAARLGGDEFALIAPGREGAARLTALAEDLVHRLGEPQPVEGRILHTGLSVGISTIHREDANPSDGLRRADLALYEAKKRGRGRVEIFHEDLEATVRRKSLVEAELRKALVSGEIRPVFQKQTSLRDGAIVGFEALARWTHPTLGSISPAEFVAVAEETGLIRDLTHQIMTAAFRTAGEWRKMGFRGRVAVNVSPMLFGSDLAEFVQDCLLSTGCDPLAAEMEITETVVLARGNGARQTIEELRRLGLTVALDDFGMGYSSLSYLQSFPVDKIKIDKAFVSKLPTSAETCAIVVAIAELGHALGMTVAGEGAETEEHRAKLRECQVDYVQGFVDGRPIDLAGATLLVREDVNLRRQRAG